MGGSGGSYFNGGADAGRQELKAVQSGTQSETYQAATNDLLGGMLVQFNDRDSGAIRTHLSEIERALGKEIEGSIDLVFGGSVAKHTYVDGFSDVDSLVVLDNCELADATPEEAKLYLVARLQERFPQTDVIEGSMSVTIKFHDIDVQLLPAVTCKNVVHISDESGDWAPINPKEFAGALTRVNGDNGGKVVPVIKLAKAIIANLPEQQRISGYHSESLAIEAFHSYAGPYTLKDMVKHYFNESASRVLQPIRDSTGQSVHVDDDLGASDSLERRIISDGFARVARRMNNADAAGTVDGWRGLFD